MNCESGHEFVGDREDYGCLCNIRYWHIGATARLIAASADRRQAYDFLRESYGERSKFVHGSKASVDPQIVLATEDYFRRVLLHCVNNRKVPSAQDLDSLLLEANKTEQDAKS